MKIAIAMSGGVDSATSAYLLKQQGYDIFALFMKNWEEKDEEGACLSKKDYEDMVATCEALDIPYYAVNFSKEYWEQVFTRFIEEIKAGLTPNPDILCNKEIKFHALLNKALSLGADCLATGHYAQTKEGALLKGKDPEKDQSYFLYTLKEEVLKKSLFPVGSLLKTEVREIAKKISLPVHDKKDSTGICFIGERNFKPFLENYIPRAEGEIRTIEGETVGKHQGIYFYTIGQRKGIGLGGPGEPYFVVDKDPQENLLLVARGKNHPALFASELTATEITWVKEPPASFPFRCSAKIRYRQADQPCTIEKIEEGRVFVRFDQPQRGITPRQSIVFYQGELCLGGALIEKKGATLFDLQKSASGTSA